MQIRLCCGHQNVVKQFPCCGKPSYRHTKHLCGWLVLKVRAFLGLMALNMLIYFYVCKFMQIRWVCGIFKSTMKIFTECQPGWKHKITLSESMSKWLLHFWTKTRFRVEIAMCRNCLCRSDWHPWNVMKFLDEANGFIEGDIFVKYYMLNRLTFKVGLYNMFQSHFRGSRPMTK